MTLFSEAIKLKDGVLHNIQYHQQRVNNTLSCFYQTTIDLSVIRDRIPPHVKNGLYKCRVLYSDKIEDVEFIPYFFRNIQKVGVIRDDEIDYSYKYANRSNLNTLLQKSGCDDIIIIKNGLVTDASSSNLVFKSAKGLFTPKECLLPGTKRKQLLERKKIREQSIRVEDIQAFNAVCFINAMVDLTDDIKVQTSSLLYL